MLNRSACGQGGTRFDSAYRFAKICRTEFYDIKPLAELAAKGADVLLNLNASPFCQASGSSATDYPAASCRPAQAARLHQHGRRGRQRQNIIPFDGEASSTMRQEALTMAVSSKSNCSSSIWTRLPTLRLSRCRRLNPTGMYDGLVMGLQRLHAENRVRARGCRSVWQYRRRWRWPSPSMRLDPSVSAYNMPSRFNTETTRSIAGS